MKLLAVFEFYLSSIRGGVMAGSNKICEMKAL